MALNGLSSGGAGGLGTSDMAGAIAGTNCAGERVAKVFF
jgi:hypothetical protein